MVVADAIILVFVIVMRSDIVMIINKGGKRARDAREL